jgi:hypothetical protein
MIVYQQFFAKVLIILRIYYTIQQKLFLSYFGSGLVLNWQCLVNKKQMFDVGNGRRP